MSLSVINRAYHATSTIDDAVIEVCLTIRSHSYNRNGVFTNPSTVIRDLEDGARKLLELAELAKNTHWPTEAEYAEV